MSTVFLSSALHLGNRLAGTAVRHQGRATWIAGRHARQGDAWLPAVGTLGADLASGTAGVGTFLAALAKAAEAPALEVIATEALRHAARHGESLLTEGRLGWYRGALGVAWAAIRGGRSLGSAELVEQGERLAARAFDGSALQTTDMEKPGLLGDSADLLAGLLAVAPLLTSSHGSRQIDNQAGALASAVEAACERGALTRPHEAPAVGLARGWSGLGLALAAWSATSGEPAGARAARRAFRAERVWLEPGTGWWAPTAHEWMSWPRDLGRSWCTGAAGIGIARLAAHHAAAAPILLAETTAAIELVRHGHSRHDPADASVCHGAAGEIELFLLASRLLTEPTHLEAARRTGRALIEAAAGLGGDYGSGLGLEGQCPTLLHGLAGTGLTLLRLHDPDGAPSPALPAIPVFETV